VLPKQLSAHPSNSPFVQQLLCRRERLEDHVILVVAVGADTRVIRSRYNVRASNCFQLWDQHANRLQRFLTEATFGCELMRSDHAFVDFIEQYLTERAEAIQSFVDD
jgi:hypothetical protein